MIFRRGCSQPRKSGSAHRSSDGLRLLQSRRPSRDPDAQVMAPGRTASLRSYSLLAATIALLVLSGTETLRAQPPATGEGNPAVLDSLGVAKTWAREGRRAEAEALLRRLLDRAESESGDDSKEAGDALDALVSLLWETGRGPAPETLDLALRTVAIKETRYGESHSEVAESLFNLGVIHAMSARFVAADSVFSRVLSIQEATEPPGAPILARTINALANVRKMSGDFRGALPLYERALALAEEREGPVGPQAILTRGGLATLLVHLGRYAEGRSLLEKQIALLEAEDHPNLPAALAGLALLHTQGGDYSAAAPILEKGLALAVSTEGPIGPDVLVIRGNLAQCLTKLGRYAEARHLLEEQRTALEDGGLAETEDMGTTLSLLAAIPATLGDLDEELELRRRSLAVRRTALPPGHFRIAESLYNLGGALGRAGDLDRDEALVLEAMAMFTESGQRGDYLADCESSLRRIEEERGNLGAALEHAEKAVRTAEERVGPDAPRVAEMLVPLGRTERLLGMTAEARGHLERAFSILTDWVGTDHPLVVDCGTELGQAELAGGNTDRGIARLLEMEGILLRHLRHTFRELPEHQALDFSAKTTHLGDLLLSLLDEYPETAPVEPIWETVIDSRAVVLDETASRNRRLASGGPEQEAQVAAYRHASTRLANLYVQGPGNLSAEAYRSLLDEARRDVESAERQAATMGAGLAEESGSDTVDLAAIRSALTPGDVLVAFVSYRSPAADAPRTETSRYRVFLLDPSRPAPLSLAIGPREEIDATIAAWREEVSRGTFRPDRTEEEKLRACTRAGAELRSVLWDPIAKEISGARRVFVVPDGQIHLVNLAALPLEDGTYLLESGITLHHLSTERELHRIRDEGAGAGGALVLGAPDFAAREPDKGTRGRIPTNLEPFRGPRPGCLRLDSALFSPLPQAEEEAREVAGIWELLAGEESASGGSVTLLTGPAATEAEFKSRAPGCELLHLATHAFVLDGDCGNPVPGARGIGLLHAETGTGDVPGIGAIDAIPAVTERNPLLLSGLALAGANDRDPVGPNEEDGILTALEIATLDLSSTRLAVLSACDTGTGRVLNGEGVFGLQRAFRVAGVRTLVSSLWSVEDESTRRWMSGFYEARLRSGLPTSEAVREASLQLLSQRRAAGESTHPFFWGAFVGSGDWR